MNVLRKESSIGSHHTGTLTPVVRSELPFPLSGWEMWAEPKKHCRYLVVTAVLSMQLGERSHPAEMSLPLKPTCGCTLSAASASSTLWGPNGNKDREQYASQALVLAEGRLC